MCVDIEMKTGSVFRVREEDRYSCVVRAESLDILG